MNLDDLSHQLDPLQRDQVILSLLTASIVETRSLQKLFLQLMSDNDQNTYNEYIRRIKEMYNEEYDKIKQQLYERYGLTPPELLGD